MNLRNRLKSGLDRMFRREDVAEEMDQELRAHVALRADDLVRRGSAARKPSAVPASSSAHENGSEKKATRPWAETSSTP